MTPPARTHHSILVVGFGPAGVQAAFFLSRPDGASVASAPPPATPPREFCVLEAAHEAGSFFRTFPRHRQLISLSKLQNFFPEPSFSLRHDWNSLLSTPADKDNEPSADASARFRPPVEGELFPGAEPLADYIAHFAKLYNLERFVKYGTRVTRVARNAERTLFLVDAVATPRDGGAAQTLHFSCETLLLGTGTVSNIVPDFPGVELAELYATHDTGLERFRNKRVLVVGGGNSGFETANHLAGHAAIVHIAIRRPIKHAWDSHFVGDLRAVNNNLLDLYHLKSLHATIGDPPVALERTERGTLMATFIEWIGDINVGVGELELKREYDHVIIATGFRWIDLDWFDRDTCDPEVKGYNGYEKKFPMLSGSWESTSVKGLHWIGGAMQSRDRAAASGFIHGFRYMVRTLCNLLTQRYPSIAVPAFSAASQDIRPVSDAILKRLTSASSLFQGFGVLCDVVVGEGGGAAARSPTASPRHAQVVSGGAARIYLDLPRAHILEAASQSGADASTPGAEPRADALLALDHYDLAFVVTLQYGFQRYEGTVTSNNFIQDTGLLNGRCGAFLHPVLQIVRRGVLAPPSEEIHLLETLDIRYTNDYKPGESATTLNGLILADSLQAFAFPGVPLRDAASGAELPPYRKLNQPALASPAERRELMARLLPLRKLWTPEEHAEWRAAKAAEQADAAAKAECCFNALPIHKGQLAGLALLGR